VTRSNYGSELYQKILNNKTDRPSVQDTSVPVMVPSITSRQAFRQLFQIPTKESASSSSQSSVLPKSKVESSTNEKLVELSSDEENPVVVQNTVTDTQLFILI
jgi:hypothetical protein